MDIRENIKKQLYKIVQNQLNMFPSLTLALDTLCWYMSPLLFADISGWRNIKSSDKCTLFGFPVELRSEMDYNEVYFGRINKIDVFGEDE